MFVLPTTVTSTSSGLTEVEFIFRSYSCSGHSSTIIMDNYSTTVPAAFSLLDFFMEKEVSKLNALWVSRQEVPTICEPWRVIPMCTQADHWLLS
jgi:hypothetical protein